MKLFDKGDITKETKDEINNDLTDIDKEAGKKLKQNRRPLLNFTEMDIPIGSKLVYVKNESNIEVTVCSDRKILYNGKETSLTALTQELLGLKYSVSPGIYWSYNGKNIHDIYDETYTLE